MTPDQSCEHRVFQKSDAYFVSLSKIPSRLIGRTPETNKKGGGGRQGKGKQEKLEEITKGDNALQPRCFLNFTVAPHRRLNGRHFRVSLTSCQISVEKKSSLQTGYLRPCLAERLLCWCYFAPGLAYDMHRTWRDFHVLLARVSRAILRLTDIPASVLRHGSTRKFGS